MARLAVTVLALLLLGSCASEAAMSAKDARAFARKALTSLGLTGVRVSSDTTRSRYRSPDPRFSKDPAVEVWQTHSDADGGMVDLYVQRRGDNAVYVKDSATAGGHLLSDAQFRKLEKFRYNPALDRLRHSQRTVGIPAIILLVAVAGALFWAVLTGRVEARPL